MDELGADCTRLGPGSRREEPIMATDHAVVLYEQTETSPEVVTIAGFLAGYSGRTREAYTLDLRQFLRWDHALASLLGLNGLRISEALGANIEDLSLERGHRTLLVHRKGGKTVTIPLAPRTAPAMDLAIGERVEGPIFLGANGGRMTRDAAARVVKRLAKRAEITKKISPHSLRHSFITAALDAGVPLRDVQEAASHADPRTTMRYDRARQSLDRHATYIVATFIAGSSRGDTGGPPAGHR